MREGGEASPVSLESHYFLPADSSVARVDIIYRIPYRFFVFVKDTSAGTPEAFAGSGDLSIEILNRDKLSVARAIRQPALSVENPEGDGLENLYLEGGISFRVPPGEYTLSVELTDRNSRRHFFDNTRPLTIIRPGTTGVTATDIIFVQTPQHPSDSAYRPLNWNTTVPLGANVDGVIVFRTAGNRDSVHPAIRIVRTRGKDTVARPVIVDSNLTDFSLNSGACVPSFGDSMLSYKILSAGYSEFATLLFHLKTDSLAEGEYSLELSARVGGQKVTATRAFTVRWIGMPMTLRNFESTVAAMKYIMSEDEYERLTHARRSDKENIFREYWKKRDPTPGTAYNELEAEYFHRADYAMTHFGTVGQPNGIESDRGRIYMVYGPPSDIQHDVLPSGPPREIWEYDTLHKQFIFTDPTRQGNYKLETNAQD